MPSKVSPTLKVLLEMRDELRKLNARTDSLEAQTREGFAVVASEMSATRDAIQQVVGLLRDRYGTQLADHERRLRALETRTG